RLSVAEHVICKAEARTEVVMIALSQRLRRSKPSGAALTPQLPNLSNLGRGKTISDAGRDVIRIHHLIENTAPRSRDEGCCEVVQFVVAGVEVISEA